MQPTIILSSVPLDFSYACLLCFFLIIQWKKSWTTLCPTIPNGKSQLLPRLLDMNDAKYFGDEIQK